MCSPKGTGNIDNISNVVMKGVCSPLCIAKYLGPLDSYIVKIEACFYVDHNYRHHCVLNSTKTFKATRKHGLEKENWDKKDYLYYMKRYKLTTVPSYTHGIQKSGSFKAICRYCKRDGHTKSVDSRKSI